MNSYMYMYMYMYWYYTVAAVQGFPPHYIAKLAICYCILHFGYYIVPGLSSQFVPYLPIQPASKVTAGQ